MTAQNIISFVEKKENAKTEDEKKELIEKLKELDQLQQGKAENSTITQEKQLEQLNQLKDLLQSDKCNETCKELVNYSISELAPVANNKDLHVYNETKYALVELIIMSVTDDSLSSMVLGSITKNSNKAKIPATGASVASDISKIDEIISKVESNAGKGGATTQADKVAAQAQQDLINEINKFTSQSQASKNSTMVGAYDPITGKTAVGSSNATISAETLHPNTVAYIEKQLGAKIGEFTSFCKNKAGACAEVSAADLLVRQGVDPSKIKFTEAVRPRVVYNEGKITPDAIIAPCKNCEVTWPK